MSEDGEYYVSPLIDMGELLVLGSLSAIAFLNMPKRVEETRGKVPCRGSVPRPRLDPMQAIEVTNGRMSDYPGVYKRPGYYAENARDFERRADAMSVACMPAREGFHAATGGVVKGYVPGLKRATDVIGSRRMMGSQFVPFVKKGNTYSSYISYRTLETFTGGDSLTGAFLAKGSANEPDQNMFAPAPNRQPARLFSRDVSRVNLPNYYNNQTNFDPDRVGPRVGIPADQLVSNEGLHPMLRILPDAIDESKHNQLPALVKFGASALRSQAARFGTVDVNRPHLLAQGDPIPQVFSGPRPSALRPEDISAFFVGQRGLGNATSESGGRLGAAALHIPAHEPRCIAENDPRRRAVGPEAMFAAGGGMNAASETAHAAGSYARGVGSYRDRATREVSSSLTFGQPGQQLSRGYVQGSQGKPLTNRAADSVLGLKVEGVGKRGQTGGASKIVSDGCAVQTQRGLFADERTEHGRARISSTALAPRDTVQENNCSLNAALIGYDVRNGNRAGAAGPVTDARTFQLANHRDSENLRFSGQNRGFRNGSGPGETTSGPTGRTDSCRAPAGNRSAWDYAAVPCTSTTMKPDPAYNDRIDELDMAERQLASNELSIPFYDMVRRSRDT
jgi:hypothetical protein